MLLVNFSDTSSRQVKFTGRKLHGTSSLFWKGQFETGNACDQCVATFRPILYSSICQIPETENEILVGCNSFVFLLIIRFEIPWGCFSMSG